MSEECKIDVFADNQHSVFIMFILMTYNTKRYRNASSEYDQRLRCLAQSNNLEPVLFVCDLGSMNISHILVIFSVKGFDLLTI